MSTCLRTPQPPAPPPSRPSALPAWGHIHTGATAQNNRNQEASPQHTHGLVVVRIGVVNLSADVVLMRPPLPHGGVIALGGLLSWGERRPEDKLPQHSSLKKKKSMSREEGKLIVLTCKRSSEPCLLNCDTHPVADWHSHLSFSSHSNLIVINCYFLTGSTLAFVSSVRTSSHVLLSFSTSLPSLHRRASPPLEESGPAQGSLLLQGLDPLPLWQLGGSRPGFPSGAYRQCSTGYIKKDEFECINMSTC